MSTDTTEKGLETLIVRHMTTTGYLAGSPQDYDRAHALDVPQLFAFLCATQPQTVDKLGIAHLADAKDINRLKFLSRLSGEIGKRGVVDVLRKGIDHHPAGHVDLFYGTPSAGNAKALALHAGNRFTITRQLAYSLDETRRALDLGLFINGLPIATFELKNSLTKQTVVDAVAQYQRDRDPKEKLFEFGRCVVHLAVDDSEVRMCTQLAGKASWFLPLNKGHNDGAGNPPNPAGLKTDYLWRELLTPASLTDILENYAQIVEVKHPKTKKIKRSQVFPRYHQLDVVRRVLADVRVRGVGKRYLIQHSAGSGKSNSIAWLAHQLIGVQYGGKPAFDSVIVVTDRRILDDQIQRTIQQFMQVGATVAAVTGVGTSKTEQLRKFIADGKKIIITTIQTFPFALKVIGDEHRGRQFGIVIDEAHSSQSGKTASAMSATLNTSTDDAGEADTDPEDVVNNALEERMQARKMVTNASYFAFTATPKNKTLEMFGDALPPDAEGKVRHQPFHGYTMKQAVQEHFILDVLKNYTPVQTYVGLIKKVEEDPLFDKKKAQKKLRRYVEEHEHAIRLKTEIMVDHFHNSVLAAGKIGGQARAMVVCSSIERAIRYFKAFQGYLVERKSPYRAIVAFSGEPEFEGLKVTEASLNGFASSEIADKIQEDPFRFLICADKFQTGYDEPLLHTMYVDKALSGIKAVQTLSRLNRAHPKKRDCFVLDFQNELDTIKESFQPFFRTTLLSGETDPNKLNDQKTILNNAQVYTPEQVDEVVALFLAGAERDKLDPVLDACAAVYTDTLDEDQQVTFKGTAKAFCRTYDFLASIIPSTNATWEKLSIFLNLLVAKLPAPKEEDLSKGIIDAIDMDTYQVDKQAALALELADAEGLIDPDAGGGGTGKPEPELDYLSSILKSFNEQFGTIFEDSDRVVKKLRDEVAPKVMSNNAFQNAKQNTPHTARMAHDMVLGTAMQILVKDDIMIYKQYVENAAFKRFVSDMVYSMNNQQPQQHPLRPS